MVMFQSRTIGDHDEDRPDEVFAGSRLGGQCLWPESEPGSTIEAKSLIRVSNGIGRALTQRQAKAPKLELTAQVDDIPIGPSGNYIVRSSDPAIEQAVFKTSFTKAAVPLMN